MVNLSSFIRFHASRTPERLAVVFKDQRISFGELLRRIEKTAGFLVAQGVKPGDVVAVVMKNSAAFLEIAFAVSHLGAVFLPINFRLATDEVGYITSNAEAKLLLADAEFAATVEKVPSKIIVDEASQSDSTALSGDHAPAPGHVRRPEDLFRLMYTSGTTDRPKGVMHTYDNFYWKCIDHVIALGLNSADRLLVTGPLYHVGAFDLPGVAVLWVGGMLCVHRDFDVECVLDSIASEGLTGAWLAPVMLGSILAHPDRGRFNVSRDRKSVV
jgi:fatty-acyl-CoA synthase